MGFGISPAALTEFASRPYIRQALANPFHPHSVLSFFTGVDYKDKDAAEKLQQGQFILEASPLWFGGGDEYDELCCAFIPVIREAGKGALSEDPWQTTIDGKCAQLVLFDQLSRNCFRGTDEAFCYDELGTALCNDLARVALSGETNDFGLEGTFYPPYASFVATGLMHSEQLENHETCVKVLDWAKANVADEKVKAFFQGQEGFEMEHKNIIDRFGRYPHRNAKLGRSSTPEEREWLSKDDELPGWAKSQG